MKYLQWKLTYKYFNKSSNISSSDCLDLHHLFILCLQVLDVVGLISRTVPSGCVIRLEAALNRLHYELFLVFLFKMKENQVLKQPSRTLVVPLPEKRSNSSLFQINWVIFRRLWSGNYFTALLNVYMIRKVENNLSKSYTKKVSPDSFIY